MILRTKTCILICIIIPMVFVIATADDPASDYGDVGGHNGEDEIYDPAQLEQEVEEEQKTLMENEEEDATAITEQSVEISTTTTEKSFHSDENDDENTAAEEMEDSPTQKQEERKLFSSSIAPPSNEDSFEEFDESKAAATTTVRPLSMPEYVRKAKAERQPEQNRTIQLDFSDYNMQEQTSQEDDEQPQLVAQAQVQQLPVRNKSKPFRPISNDDYFYDEPAMSESSSSSSAATTTTTTTSEPLITTSTTTTTTTTTESPPPPVIQARFGFPWPTSAPPPLTTSPPPAATTTPRKQPKNIHMSSPKPELLPADQLRNYIKDVYIRMPLAVIVDPSPASLEKTKTLYIAALQDKNINIKIVLVTLNAAGIPSAFSFNNTREFIAGLNSTKEHEGGDAFIGVLHAAELVPYDSAVFISTAVVAPHTDLVQEAAITLLKKRIRLFLLWYGEKAGNENETEENVGGILGEVAIRSGGEIIHIVSTEHGQHIAGNTLTLVSDAYQGAQQLDLPVDTTLSSLHVKIDAPMRRATLETPHGEINLKKLVKFRIRTENTDNTQQREQHSELDAYVPLSKLRKATTFTLKLTPESNNQPFNVFIRAERRADVFLGDIIQHFDSYTRVAKPVATHAKIQFPESKKESLEDESDVDSSPKTEVETFSETEVHRTPVHSMNQTQLEDQQHRSSLSGMLMQRCGTRAELSVQSKLLLSPGKMSQLLFEVTNMRMERVYQSVQVTDERRYLVQLSPSSFYLGPRETAIVRLTVLAPTGTAHGTTDRITFTTYGRGESASLAANLKVISTLETQDNTGPSLSWEFGSRCEYVPAESLYCGERFWTLDVTAQDWQSGMMRLQTIPAEGLFYRNYYTAGTTEPLKATYMASCCEPRVTIAAYDAAGNQRTINIDVRDIWLTDAAIAAVVLGCILLLLLIILLIASIVWCCRRRKVSLDLPTYRSHSTRSRE